MPCVVDLDFDPPLSNLDSIGPLYIASIFSISEPFDIVMQVGLPAFGGFESEAMQVHGFTVVEGLEDVGGRVLGDLDGGVGHAWNHVAGSYQAVLRDDG